MADIKVLKIDANGDATEIDKTLDSIVALSFDTATYSLTDALLGDVTNKMIKSDGSRAFAANQDFGGFKLTGLGNGTLTTDAATYGQLTSLVNGLDWKQYARAATTAALPAYTYANGSSGVGATITATASAALAAQDGVTLALNDRLLVMNETGANAPYNGLYAVTQLGDGTHPFILTRTADADNSSTILPEMVVPVAEGTTQAKHAYNLTTTSPITVGTTNLIFSEFIVSLLQGGNGINITGDVVSAVLDGTSLHFSGSNIAINFSTTYNDLKAVSASDLSSTSAGKGASVIGVSGSFTAQTNVQGALQELYGLAGAHLYTAGTGGVTKGDLVYLSASNTVSTMPITAAHVPVGLATSTAAASATVEVKRFDYVLASVLSGATVDQKQYWTGTGYSTTMPSGLNNYVWQAGVAIDATDLLADVVFIKRNAAS